MNDFISKLNEKRALERAKMSEATKHVESLTTNVSSANRIVDAVSKAEPRVEIKNQISTEALAKSDDIKSAVDSINALTLTTFLSSKDSWVSLVSDLAGLSEQLTTAVAQIKKDGVVRIENSLQTAVSGLENAVKSLKNVEISSDKEQTTALNALVEKLGTIEFKPVIKVPKPEVIIQEKEDSTDLLDVLQGLRDDLAIMSSVTPEIDINAITNGLNQVANKVQDLINKPVPVSEFPTTIKISNQAGQDILDPTAGYAPSDVDEAGDPKYYGFLASDGRWYIMQSTSDTTYRYVSGSSSYSTNWTGRAGLTYDYFSEAF